MKATDTFIAHPRLAAVVAIIAVVAGAASAWFIPVSLYPSLARPAISVSCTYPGANAMELMNTVAGPIEEKVNGVEGMDRMTSGCHDTGAYSLTIQFDIGYDRDIALMKVQSKVQQAMSLLPQEVKNTGVTVESGTTEELGILTLRSKEGKLSLDEVADCVYGVVNPAVLRVAGVDKSTVKYGRNAVRVWMNPERLAALGLCTEDVVSAIKTQNVQASLGTVGANPSDDDSATVMTLVSKGRLSSPEDFGEIIVRTGADGGIVRLKDIATVGMGPENYASSAIYGEEPAVCIVMYLLPGANPLETMDKVRAELKGLEPYLPEDIAWDMTYDSTEYMRRVLRNAAFSIAIAFALVFAGLWVFLRSLRGALAVAASLVVPASLAATTLCAAGFQVNLPVLYAVVASLAFSAGMAARSFDDSRRGVMPGAGHLAAAAVVAFAAIPLALVDGVQGVLFRQFSAVFAAMAASSAFNSILIVPVVARRLFRGEEPRCGASAAKCGWSSMLLLAALSGVAAYAVFQRIPKAFVPEEDLGYLYIDCKTAEGTSMAKTRDIMRRIFREVDGLAGVRKCATILGESIINGSGENNAKMLVVLDDWGSRGADRSEHEISRRIQKIVADVPDAEVFVLGMSPIKGIGVQGGVTVMFQTIGDNDPVKFSRETLRMRGELAKSPLAEIVTGGFFADTPHLRVTVDRAKCELMNVPMSSVFSVLQHNLGSIYVNDVNIGTQVNRVTAMAEWCGRARPEDVGALYVRSKTGAMVPVGALVTCREEIGTRSCYRRNQFLYCTEQFIPKAGISESEAIREVLRICSEKLSPGFVNGWERVTYESMKSRGDEGLLISLSLLLAYFALVVRMESWRDALRMMLPSVLAVFGAVSALWCLNVPFSVYSRYAVVMLVALTSAMSLLSDSASGFFRRAFLPLLAAVTALPLVLSSGAGAVGSRSFGATMLGGFLVYAIGYGLSVLNRSDQK